MTSKFLKFQMAVADLLVAAENELKRIAALIDTTRVTEGLIREVAGTLNSFRFNIDYEDEIDGDCIATENYPSQVF